MSITCQPIRGGYVSSFPSRYEHKHEGPDWEEYGFCPRCEDYGFLACSYRGRHRWSRLDGRCKDCGTWWSVRLRRRAAVA